MRGPYPYLLAALALAAAGCDGTPAGDVVIVGPAEIVALDYADVVSWEAGLFWVAADPYAPLVGSTVVDADDAAAAVARRAAARFSPAGCLQASVGGNLVTFTLDGCAGPFGLRDGAGVVTAMLRAAPGGMQIAIGSADLRAGGARVTLNAVGLYSAAGDERRLLVSTMGGGVGPRGNGTLRQGQYTVDWIRGASCVTIDGAIASSTPARDGDRFSRFAVCTQGCPRGGTVTRQDPLNGAMVTTTYDGSSTVSWVSTSGQRGSAMLACP